MGKFLPTGFFCLAQKELLSEAGFNKILSFNILSTLFQIIIAQKGDSENRPQH
jgi:hypothetical protein